jgi:hypothetical protein
MRSTTQARTTYFHYKQKKYWITRRKHEHGHGKREGKQKGKSDKRITESKARQKEALHCAQT